MRHLRSIVLEVTQTCNHDCLHCYNVWKNQVSYPTGVLETPELLRILGQVLDESGIPLVSISGGEPLLRKDILDIIDFLNNRSTAVNLLTNGSLLTVDSIQRLTPDKISIFEIPVLAACAETHDRMTGKQGSFDAAVRAVVDLKAAGQTVITTFVATRLNVEDWRRTVELALVLGADGIMFNRFNPGGEGFRNIELLQCAPEQITSALSIANELSVEYSLPISCSIPLPPCLIDTTPFRNLGFGHCALGSDNAYFTIDPLGNLRPCNHSPTVLGNLGDNTFTELVENQATHDYETTIPDTCRGCEHERLCLGNCRAAAEACYGSILETDPFVKTFLV